MTEILAALKSYWGVISAVATLALGAAILWLKTQFVTRDEIAGKFSVVGKSVEELKKSLEEHADETDGRLVRLEAITEHLPTAREFQELTIQVERQSVMIETMVKLQSATSEGVKRLEDYWIMNGSKNTGGQ